jgi:sodium pump decarboxylase gamma subunit
MYKKIILLIVALVATATTLSAQGRKALRINEVMVVNESSIVDDFGEHGAWIELFNSNFAPLEISSVYLTNDKNDPKKYPVPLGDVNTKMPKRQHVIFWADGQHSKGTFHTSFTLTPGQENWIGIYDADGKTLIDEVTIPANLAPNTSYARVQDGGEGWEVRDNSGDKYVTPSSNNQIKAENAKVQKFAENESHGFALTIMAMCIVFSALLILCLSFYGIGTINRKISRRNKAISQGQSVENVSARDLPQQDSGEEIAAIVMALHEHLNAHDTESTILTINKVKRAYSPWSSKIYSLRETPRR